MCLPKPDELIGLYEQMPTLFETLRQTFGVPERHALEIGSVERNCSETDERATTAALALHYIQSMRVLTCPQRRVRIIAIVNTSACLHTMLSILASECELPEVAAWLRQSRDWIGVAAAAVANADLASGGRHRYMQ